MSGCNSLLLVFFIFSISTVSSAQVFPSATPTPRPGSRQANVPPTVSDNDLYDRLRTVEMMGQKGKRRDHPLLDTKTGIYRLPSKEEIEILAVSAPFTTKYAALFRGPNSGLVKLNAESSCISDDDVVVASEKCIVFKMPGSGTAFSFRTESYRLPRLSDVILVDGTFMTGGVFQFVIMTEIGDVPLESVTLQHGAIKYLSELKPAQDSIEFTRFNDELIKGFVINGHKYGKNRPVKADSVYLIRSIAYRGHFPRTIEGIQYNELDYDKRRDVIVAFRVVDIDSSKNVTIAWKQLKDTEAPKLKLVN